MKPLETFEELLSPEIDALYSGALFLSGGHEVWAEGLLAETVGSAFRMFRCSRPEEEFGRWIEREMVHSFIRREGLDAGDQSRKRREADDTVQRLFAAAARMEPSARLAVWLVMVRRWRYEAAAELMGLDVHALVDLLGSGRELAAAVLGRDDLNTSVCQ